MCSYTCIFIVMFVSMSIDINRNRNRNIHINININIYIYIYLRGWRPEAVSFDGCVYLFCIFHRGKNSSAILPHV